MFNLFTQHWEAVDSSIFTSPNCSIYFVMSFWIFIIATLCNFMTIFFFSSSFCFFFFFFSSRRRHTRLPGPRPLPMAPLLTKQQMTFKPTTHYWYNGVSYLHLELIASAPCWKKKKGQYGHLYCFCHDFLVFNYSLCFFLCVCIL